MQRISEAMDGVLLSLEVITSDIGVTLNRMGMANETHEIADQFPVNNTILILDYWQHVD